MFWMRWLTLNMVRLDAYNLKGQLLVSELVAENFGRGCGLRCSSVPLMFAYADESHRMTPY